MSESFLSLNMPATPWIVGMNIGMAARMEGHSPSDQ
eukprot:CAMPEP_0174333116 /NCGR_PEP_ID=MMETSP0810-20121108/18877_1 /TAXON_ID=73025 ORGANISM="Eutreptiella gymnastica-like, Strain CCMP1594" /NCGR_SAMPLE_ID=MMETSP0810 /ASSEMBLY_ACC=CAM_ASM_000659 /LENGTH=35 /DNA_ID= /DNA_START= /DNA_END= /DNA_ORIENTATION=